MAAGMRGGRIGAKHVPLSEGVTAVVTVVERPLFALR